MEHTDTTNPGGSHDPGAMTDLVAGRAPVEGPARRRPPAHRAPTAPTISPRTRAVLVAAGTYALLALLAYRPIWPTDPSRLPTSACRDFVASAWYLRWTPYALAHGLNPLLTNFIGFPSGVNLAQNTSMPLLGILGAPLTLALGPVATVNTLLWLAFPASATACFVALRRWVRWAPAAFVGGLLYGFSPYMASQGSGHLNLVMVPIPPLVLLLLDELVVRQRRRPLPVGLVLGLLAAAQFLISSEVFGSTLVLAVAGVLVLAAARPREVLVHARHALVGLVGAAVVCGALIAYPAYVQLRGPGAIVGSAHGSYPFPADLLGSIVPTSYQWLAPSTWVTVSSRFILGSVVENGSYLGLPLIALLLVIVIWRWHLPLVRFAAVMGLVAFLLSLGPTLTLDTHDTGIPLPDRLLDHLPLFTSFIDARFALYVDLFAAVIVAIGIDQWRRVAQRARRQGAHHRSSDLARPSAGTAVLLVVVLVVALVPLVPRWPYPAFPTSVPSFFRTTDVRRIPAGSVALTYPYADDANDAAMLWQATASMRFRLVGGYAIVAGADRAASLSVVPTFLPSVPATLIADEVGASPGEVVPGATTATPDQVRRFLRHYRIETVLAQSTGARPAAAMALLEAALGRPTRIGGIEGWFRVPDLLARASGPARAADAAAADASSPADPAGTPGGHSP